LVNYLIGNKSRTALTRGAQAGAAFENFVMQELLKHYFNLGLTPPLYYYRHGQFNRSAAQLEQEQGIIHIKRLCHISY
jgi:hypothetical protein